MLSRAQILDLIPHGDAMCLLDRVVEWDQSGIHCASKIHLRTHPLRRGDVIAAIHLIEYGAQAAAVHGGLLAGACGQPAADLGGYLAGLRDVVLAGQRIDAITTPLAIHARREMGGPQGMIYRFAVYGDDMCQCSGRLTVMRVGRSG